MIVLSLLLAAAALPDVYVAKPGDTCVSVTARLYPDLPRKAALQLFHDANPELGPTPHKLHAGQRLFTRRLTEPDARLTFVKPEVDKRLRGRAAFEPADRDDPLFRLDAVNTQKGAAAQITFHDESAMQLDEGALVVIYGGSEAAQQGVEKSGEVELLAGEVQLDLAALRGEKQLDVRTPSAQVAARSPKARIGVDGAKMSRVAVFTGQAKVAASGAAVEVPAGFGTRVAKGKRPEKPRPLPPSPEWLGAPHVVLLTATAAIDVPLRWAASARAAVSQVRLQLGRDEKLNDRLFDSTVAGSAGGVVAAAVAPGRYYARAFAIDAAGLTSAPSATRTVDVVPYRTDRACGSPGEARFAFAPDAKTQGDLEAAVDGAASGGEIVIRKIGAHELRLAPRGQAEGAAIACEVTAPQAHASIVEASAAGATAVVRLDPALPREALTVRGLDGTQAGPLSPGAAAGEWCAPLQSASRSYRVAVDWSGVQIATASAEAPAPPLAPTQQPAAMPPRPHPPPAPPLPVELLTPPADLLGPATALFTGLPLPGAFHDHELVARATGAFELAAPGRGAALLGQLSAQLGLDDAAVGLAGTSRHLPGTGTSAVEGTLFGRLALAERDHFGLLLGLDATLPGEPGTVNGSPVRFRFSLSAGWRSGGAALWTAQAIAASAGTPGWESAYGGSLAVAGPLYLAAQLDALFSAGGESASRSALAAGAGALVRMGPFDASAALRFGLTDDGRAAWGESALVFQLGFRH